MSNQTLVQAYRTTRDASSCACQALQIEDYGLQAAAFVSPPKWHLAHTSWFFETFILKPYVCDYQVFDAAYEVLFNSYYNAIGEQFPRPQRHLLSRPTVAQVREYRDHIDAKMADLLSQINHPDRESIEQRCRLGIEHEKQHQELFFTDLKYSFFKNPIYPAYCADFSATPGYCLDDGQHDGQLNTGEARQWRHYAGGLTELGVDAGTLAFSFDNESPRHRVYLEPFKLSTRLVTNAEFQEFVDDGGYQKSQYWLADGWSLIQQERWSQPLYWLDLCGRAMEFTLYGLRERQASQPVCHISGYEAEAYANWLGLRLPTEAEWEHAAKSDGALMPPMSKPESLCLHPEHAAGAVVDSGSNRAEHDENQMPLLQMYDSCWQWTSSAYRPYPGFTTAAGAIGEYNGKFMCNQWVLRGGSCVSSAAHLRPSYRNFFYPQDRWQFSGIRLAS